MTLGMIGLGRMGAKMTERLLTSGHEVVVYDRNPDAVQRVLDLNAIGARSLSHLVERLSVPRVIWLMLPAGDPVDQMIHLLLSHLKKGDILIDGGNSYYKDSIRRAALLKEHQIAFVDVGTSAGIWGLEEGYSLMIGGERSAVKHLTPIFEALAPSGDRGWGHVGPHGAGHFAKMIHNGIEYGLMQAYAEGFAILKHKTEFDFDLHHIAEIWRAGSVVRSWLLDLTSAALQEDPGLADIAPYVEDSGEGRWTVAEAIDLNTPSPVITLALLQRLRSRDAESFSDRLLAAMRHQFGGHAIKQAR